MKSPALDTFQEILFISLRPWMNKDTPEAKYKELNHSVKKEYYTFQPLYEVDFQKPLSAKRKYYHDLIENEATQFLNAINNEISSSLNNNEKIYWVHTSLTKTLNQKLKDVKDTIETFHYQLEKLSNGSINNASLDEIYIIQFLRFQIVRIYLEIQDSHRDFLKEDALSFEELNQKYFSETLSKSYIKDAVKLKLPSSNNSINAKPPSPSFEPRAFDFRPATRGILSYETMIKNSDRFLRFEELLYANGLIDENYKFKKEHKQIQELAAVFHTLISKGYFHQRKFPGNKPIKVVDIRRFLDHRYNSSTQKQFNIWSNDLDKLADFVGKRHWLDKLPVS